jgi:predicted ATPase/DNA-binding XRE family transcriptional regulator
MEERAAFGMLLRRYRLAAGLTQEVLAERTGLSVRGISDLERGARRAPRPGTVSRLAQALDLSDAERSGLQGIRDRQATRDRRAAAGAGSVRRQRLSSLPTPLTGFVGRERELAEIGDLLGVRRLLTLVGPGGVGKSRLGLEAASVRRGRHPDGVWLVDLAPLADPALLPRTVASVLGVVEGPRRSLEEALEWLLRERDLLLILDNCEHLIDACAELVARLLRSCPHLRVIATSREPLGIGGEQLYDVAPLTVPAEGECDLARLRANEAVHFFAERARLARPSFELVEDGGEAVTTICRRLDGIPLALELAAARLRTMSAAEIALRLDDRFGLLTSGGPTTRPRHRTLRGMVDWSWELLSEPERVLLRRLAVFAGGWTAEAAEDVAGFGFWVSGVGGPDAQSPDTRNRTPRTLVVLAALVDRSLVVSDDWRGSRRYRLLDTIRGYAEERLREAGEEAALRRRHQSWCLRLLEASETEMLGAQLGWLRRMDAELENLRTALDWCRVEPASAERALRASFGIWAYWDIRGHGGEARRRFEELLALLPAGPPTPGRVIGQCFYIHVLGSAGKLATAVALLEETRPQARQLGDRVASFWFGWLDLQCLAFIGGPGAPATARAALTKQRESPIQIGDSLLPWVCGIILLGAGEVDEAERLLQQAVDTTALEHVRDLAADFLGMVAFRRGDLPAAQRHFQQALAGSARFGDLRPCAVAVEHLADVAGALRLWERAARLQGAAEMLLDRSNKIPLPIWQLDPASTSAACRTALGEEAFAAMVAAGRAMTPEQAIAFALDGARPT